MRLSLTDEALEALVGAAQLARLPGRGAGEGAVVCRACPPARVGAVGGDVARAKFGADSAIAGTEFAPASECPVASLVSLRSCDNGAPTS